MAVAEHDRLEGAQVVESGKWRGPVGPVWDAAKAEPNWLIYRLDPKDGQPGKFDKVPTIDGERAAAASLAARLTFDGAEALAEVRNALSGAQHGERGYLGIGYFARSGSAMRAFDLDNCIAADGTLTEAAREIIDLKETYAEISPSGRGLRLWAAPTGDGDDDAGSERNGFGESGADGKFFTFTGNRFNGSPREVRPAPRTRSLVRDRRGPSAAVKGDQWEGPIENIDEAETKAKLIEFLASDSVFRASWEGDDKFPSRSERDFSIIGRLARAGFTFSEVVHLVSQLPHDRSAVSEEWAQGIERQMRRAFGRARPLSAEEEFEPVDHLLPCAAAPVKPGSGTTVLWIREDDLDRPDLDEFWRVDGLVPLEGVGVIYGKPGSGKTFLSLDMGLCVATGRPWLDRDVESCPVVYVASEGGLRAARNRIIGWRQNRGIKDTSGFSCAVANFALTGGADALIDEIRSQGVAPGLIVIDTLNQNFGPGDENAAQDMSRFVSAVKAVQRAFRCFVLVVHHSGKDETKGSRGHTALLGALDFEAKIAGEVGEAKSLEITKSREGESGERFWFRLERITLGTSNKGRPVTTCVPVYGGEEGRTLDRNAAIGRLRSDHHRFAMKALEKHADLISEFKAEPMSMDAWKAATIAAAGDAGVDLNPKNLPTSLNRLIENHPNLVRCIADGRVDLV